MFDGSRLTYEQSERDKAEDQYRSLDHLQAVTSHPPVQREISLARTRTYTYTPSFLIIAKTIITIISVNTEIIIIQDD